MTPARGEVRLFDTGMVRALHKLGTLKREDFDHVFAGLLRWLGHAG